MIRSKNNLIFLTRKAEQLVQQRFKNSNSIPLSYFMITLNVWMQKNAIQLAGVELQLIIAIDMTKSNRDAKEIDSLHSMHPQSKNQYKEAISAVCEILLNYDHDKKVPLFGFGGKPKMPNLRTNLTLHCFPLSGDPYNCEAEGLEGIIKMYEQSVENIEFDGPTYLNMVIQQTRQLAMNEQECNGNQYFILLILTDGIYFDKASTKKSIVNSSHLPMSILIVGIGNEDFSEMEILDGDDGLLDEDGNAAQRDLVQFVPFNKFKDNPECLAQQVLEELPTQLVEYMELVGQKPKRKSYKELEQKVVPSNQNNQSNFDFDEEEKTDQENIYIPYPLEISVKVKQQDQSMQAHVGLDDVQIE